MSKRKLDPTDISGLIDELDRSAFFRQPQPPELQSDKAPSNQATKDTKQQADEAESNQSSKEPIKYIPMEVTNERTMKRTDERLTERTKIRHTFDILADQLLSLREIALEREKVFGSRVLIGDLVQEALDMFITKERTKE